MSARSLSQTKKKMRSGKSTPGQGDKATEAAVVVMTFDGGGGDFRPVSLVTAESIKVGPTPGLPNFSQNIHSVHTIPLITQDSARGAETDFENEIRRRRSRR